MIDIGSVLRKFDDTYDEQDFKVKSYGIMFITADGRVRPMESGRKNVKSPSQQLRAPLQARGKGQFHLKRHGSMLVHDLKADKPRTVKAAMIFSFKDFNSNIWHNVKH